MVGVQGGILARIVIFACLCACLFLVQTAQGQKDLGIALLYDVLFVSGLLAFGDIHRASRLRDRRWAQPVVAAIILVFGVAFFARTRQPASAWVLVVGLFLVAAWAERAYIRPVFGGRGMRFAGRMGLALIAGFAPALLWQIESGFADEEFFVITQAMILSLLCFLYMLGQARLDGRVPEEGNVVPSSGVRGILVIIILAAGLAGLVAGGLVSYQRSFYSMDPPPFAGVTKDSPFVVSRLAPEGVGAKGKDVFRRLVARAEALPDIRARESGMLALTTREPRWAEAFREDLLAEARAGFFTEPAHSIKSIQFDASMSVYCYARVKELFPDLFSGEDKALLADWLAAVNRRALTVEWVDWLYALAFATRPVGPYANQEIGAALLAILEVGKLSAPELSPRNHDYLKGHVGGWNKRFRNTDDTFIYQGLWIRNAFLQSLCRAASPEAVRNMRLSFDWLLLQIVPGGARLTYNHPSRASSAGVLYLGAYLLKDPQYLWLADRALGRLEERGAATAIAPGSEHPLDLGASPPTAGTALLYGDSGLPNQIGPLAPDKIVFRDGWAEDSVYLLMNLRFTGWHRYKATGAIISLYQEGALVFEQTAGARFKWLPKGRAVFRDKRVPRENLNGLLVPSDGMASVFSRLTGTGDRWAQDPPHYARVELFETLGEVDAARIRLDDWNGWSATRSIYFIHGGLVVVVDSAAHRRGARGAGISWHLRDGARWEGDCLWLRTSEAPARVVFSSGVLDASTTKKEPGWTDDAGGIGMVCGLSERDGSGLASTFLLREWADAQVHHQIVRDEISGKALGQYIEVKGEPGTVRILHNESGGRIRHNGLAASGMALVVWTRPGAPLGIYCLGKGEYEAPAEPGAFRVVDPGSPEFAGRVRWLQEDDRWLFRVDEEDQSGVLLLERSMEGRVSRKKDFHASAEEATP